jgi:hypothetical protein
MIMKMRLAPRTLSLANAYPVIVGY